MPGRRTPGVKAVHAVDAAGVHPLLLADRQRTLHAVTVESVIARKSLLTQANAVLGQGQTVAGQVPADRGREDDPGLGRPARIPTSFRHVLERVDWRRDLHFQTCTTIDTLDYSGGGMNRRIEADRRRGPRTAQRESLPERIDGRIAAARGFSVSFAWSLPGNLVRSRGRRRTRPTRRGTTRRRRAVLRGISRRRTTRVNRVPTASSSSTTASFHARTLNNFLWVTFTRSNPAATCTASNRSSTANTGAAAARW